jgi:hypothetical protein
MKFAPLSIAALFTAISSATFSATGTSNAFFTIGVRQLTFADAFLRREDHRRVLKFCVRLRDRDGLPRRFCD